MSDTQNTSPSGIYAFAECEVVDMQNGGVLLIDKHSDAQMLVAPPVAQSMQLCRVFRTLEQHANVLTSSIPELAGQRADVMNVLTMVRDAGLMVTAESVCDKLNAPVPPPVDLPPTRVFIITCDRPAAVERLLESMLHAGNLTHHEALFLIDDSRDPQNAAGNREAVERFNLTCPRNLTYFGAEEASAYMNALIDELPEQEESIRFLIDRERWADQKTYGLARNFTLLLSVGCRAIVMDDDVICAAVESPHKKSGLQFGQLEREIDFYHNDQDMLGRTTRAEFDPLNGHAKCLGLNMGQAISKLGGEPVKPQDLVDGNAAYLSLWDATSPIFITQSGTLGDPGTPGTDWVYSVDPASAQRLAAFPAGLEGALSSRCYWMGQPRPMFTKMSVISQVTGIDNSQLMPPYFPIFRGEDYLFGAMAEFIHPNAAVLEYDWSVPHMPLEERRGEPHPKPMDGKGMININKYVTDRTNYNKGVTPESRLANLALMATFLAESELRGLKSVYRKEVAEAQGAELARLSAYLQDGSIRPPSWENWLQESVNQIAISMQTAAEVSDNSNLPNTMSSEEVLEQFRALCHQFALALGSWEVIQNAASERASALFH